MTKQISIPGINVQWPWSELISSGRKNVETRRYRIPKQYIGVPIALIETPGPRGKREHGISKAQITGIIVFQDCFQYKNRDEWREDFTAHQVSMDSPFAFSKDKNTWGWRVKVLEVFNPPLPAPAKRGIVFTKNCTLLVKKKLFSILMKNELNP